MPKPNKELKAFQEAVLLPFLESNEAHAIFKDNTILNKIKQYFPNKTDKQILRMCQDFRVRYILPSLKQAKADELKNLSNKKLKQVWFNLQEVKEDILTTINTFKEQAQEELMKTDVKVALGFKTNLLEKSYKDTNKLMSEKHNLLLSIITEVEKTKQEREIIKQNLDNKAKEITQAIDNILEAKLAVKDGKEVCLREVLKGDLTAMNGLSKIVREAKDLIGLLELQYKYIRSPVYHYTNQIEYLEKVAGVVSMLSSSRFDDTKVLYQAGMIEQAMIDNGNVVLQEDVKKDNKNELEALKIVNPIL